MAAPTAPARQPDAARAPLPAADKALMEATRAYASANNSVAWWQVLSLQALLGLTVWGMASTPLWTAPLWSFVVGMLLVRTFVLQHDCGHLSLFSSRRVNDAMGLFLSCWTSVPFEPWRTEHNWHHQNQGKLSHRGVDLMNSPMTVTEAHQQPTHALARVRKISIRNIFFLGAASLMFERKRISGFFQFRPAFRWPFHRQQEVIRGFWLTCALAGLWYLGLLALLGPWRLLLAWLPGMVLAGGFGSWLFWVQHNFEATYHAPDDEWRFVQAAVQGSSYLRLPAWLNWVSASIGLHHVHHLNARIPNYRLEAARTGIAQLAAVAPLHLQQLPASFVSVFWDEAGQRMVPPQPGSHLP